MKQFLIFSAILAIALSSPLAKKEQDTPAYTVVNTWEIDDTKVSIKSSRYKYAFLKFNDLS